MSSPSKQAVWPPVSADTVCPRPPLTLTFDHLTLKLVCESHLRWGTFLPNLGTLGFSMGSRIIRYVRDGRTDGQTDGRTKATLISSYGRGIILVKLGRVRKWLYSDVNRRVGGYLAVSAYDLLVLDDFVSVSERHVTGMT